MWSQIEQNIRKLNIQVQVEGTFGSYLWSAIMV